LARMLTPSTMRARASPPKMTSFAAMFNSPDSVQLKGGDQILIS